MIQLQLVETLLRKRQGGGGGGVYSPNETLEERKEA